MKESDFMTIYNYDKHEDYKFEYKKDHILVDKYYDTTKKYAPYTSMLSKPDLSEEELRILKAIDEENLSDNN